MQGNTFSRLLTAVYVLSLIFSAAGATIFRIKSSDIQNYNWIVKILYDFIQDQSWVLIALPALAAGAKSWGDHVKSRWVKKIVQSTLTQLSEQIFGHLGGAKDEHRATLFVRRTWAWRFTRPWHPGRWPWSGWLVPVARSGHTAQKVRSRFLVPDRSVGSEGLGGKVWRNKSIVTVVDLPDLSKVSSVDDLKLYQTKSACAEHWLKRRVNAGDLLPRSLMGIPVELDGNLWGVVVLDSRDPSPFLGNDQINTSVIVMFSFTLTKLVERAKL